MNRVPRVPGPIQVITSDPGQPLTYAPIENTSCRYVDHLAGNYEYYLCANHSGSPVPVCEFLSMIEILRIPNHPETFHVVEKYIPGSSDGHKTSFRYIQLWEHSGCMLIHADENFNPTWEGANTYMNDSSTIILAFHGGSVGLLKKIQNFPILVPPSPPAPSSFTSEVEVPVSGLLVPQSGFEERDNVVVSVYGKLPNGCYSLGRTQVDFDEFDRKNLRIHQFAHRQTTGICSEGAPDLPPHLRVEIPFDNEISVGTLREGDYQISFLGPLGKLGTHSMMVAHSEALTADAPLYAGVTSIDAPDFVSEFEDIQVTLRGILNSSCTKVDPEVEVVKSDSVFLLLPTLTVKKKDLCAQVLSAFETGVNLGKNSAGTYLIQVRSMTRKLISKIIHVIPNENFEA